LTSSWNSSFLKCNAGFKATGIEFEESQIPIDETSVACSSCHSPFGEINCNYKKVGG
jgi:hypothetical protein